MDNLEEMNKFLERYSLPRMNQEVEINFTLLEKSWKWINGSFLNSNILPVSGDAEEDSCVCISRKQFTSDTCAAENRGICQKELKPVRNKEISSSKKTQNFQQTKVRWLHRVA